MSVVPEDVKLGKGEPVCLVEIIPFYMCSRPRLHESITYTGRRAVVKLVIS